MEKVKLDWSLIAYAVLESYRNSNKTKILMLLKRYVEFLLKNQSTKYNILKPFNFCLLHSQSMGNSLNGWRVQRTTWPINLPASIYPEKTVIQTDTCTSVFITALFTIARTWKQPRCPSTDEWIKMWSLYTMECYSAIKNEWNSVICRDMDEPRVSYTAWSKSEREKQILYINTHMYLSISISTSYGI